MKAAVITERGAKPVIQDFRAPEPKSDCVLIDVETTGLGGWDVLGAYRLGVEYPCVIRGEGVGRNPQGQRVYFGERSVLPWGSWAEKTLVPEQEVWRVPDDVDDKTAIAMGIAATGALVPLEQANIQTGEKVLILGATGTLGQIALQLAKHLGAGHVTAAARDRTSLERLKRKNLCDSIVCLDGQDDAAALKADAGDGYDVVLDLVCGEPMLNALKATRWGARIMTIGTGAGREVTLDMAHLLFRTLTVVGTGQRPAQDREQIWRRLLQINKEISIQIDFIDYDFDNAADAWQAQINGPHAKITAKIG